MPTNPASRTLAVVVPLNLHRAVRLLAVQRSLTVSALLSGCLQGLFKEALGRLEGLEALRAEQGEGDK